MERSGGLLERVGNVFWNLTSSDTSDQLQALELKLSPRVAAHNSQIYSDPTLFKRVQAITESDQALDPEALQLLKEIHQSFVRAGAHLSESARERVNEITESLAGLTTQFGQNVLQDVNEFELVVGGAEDISGLPDSVLNAAKSEAESRGKSGQYVFTISRSSITPFLQYADSRSLREKLYKAYTDCGR